MVIFAIIIKEIRLLIRDKIGLLILFILPVFLLVLVSLSQQNTDNPAKSLSVLLLNQDTGKSGREIAKQLIKKADFKIVEYHLSSSNTKQKAKNQVASGHYDAFIIIDKNLSKDIKKNLRQLATKRSKAKITLNSVLIYTDPTIPQSVVKSLKSGLDYMLQTIQLEATQNMLIRSRQITDTKSVEKWFNLEQHFASTSKTESKKGFVSNPNTVQQNVPAWTLFGMFFIVIPLAGQMIRERSMGVIQRIRISPVPQIVHVIGRVICYLVLNIIQMSFMLLVAVYLLPHFDLPALNLAGHVDFVYLVGFCASLAAIGFGLLIGMYATSYQQATILGPFIIIIVAAVSGIFVPMYLMPDSLKYISEFSPLYWAQNAFLDIFVRNVGFGSLWPNMLKLIGFFILMLILSLLPFTRLMSHRKVK
ncbi:MAG: ABC transporter permease [Coxiellaceae bacterium]|nr:ABC transporter permease [Coxiellaceae bacterium]